MLCALPGPRGMKMTRLTNRLFEGDEAGGVGGTNTGTTVLDGLVGDGELTKVVTSHLRLDLNLVEGLTVVDTNDGADHLGNNDHVPEVGLDDLGLLVSRGVLLGGPELLDEAHGLALQTTLEPTAGTAVDEIDKLLGREVQELLEVDTTVGVLAESTLLLEFSSSSVSLQGTREERGRGKNE